MSNVVRNVLAVLAGLVIGTVVNIALITISPMIIPLPAGVDPNNSESLSRAMANNVFETKHYIMPFLAHALGSLIGAIATFLIAGSYKSRLAYVVALVFLLGGIAAAVMLPAPVWFKVLDLVVAYIPMAWLAAQIGGRMSPGARVSQRTA